MKFSITSQLQIDYPSDELLEFYSEERDEDYREILNNVCRFDYPRYYEIINDSLYKLTILRHKVLSPHLDGNKINSSQLQIGYLHDNKMGAKAKTYNGLDIVLISFGFLFNISDLCLSLYTTDDFMPSIGEPNKNSHSLTDMGGFVVMVLSGLYDSGWVSPYGYVGPYLTDYTQKCSVRGQFASSVIDCILYYVFLHEVGHLERGHIYYLDKELSVNELSELEFNINNEGVSYGKVPIKYLEFDADRFAISKMLDLRHSGLGYLHCYYSQESVLMIVATAISIVHRLFDYSWPSNIRDDLLTHPSPAVRSSGEYISLCTEGLKISGEFQKIYESINDEIGNAWNATGLYESSYKKDASDRAFEAAFLWREYDTSYKEIVTGYENLRTQSIYARWRKIREQY